MHLTIYINIKFHNFDSHIGVPTQCLSTLIYPEFFLWEENYIYW